MINWLRLLFALTSLAPVAAQAHSGGTNSAGCHTNRATGVYHCHTPTSPTPPPAPPPAPPPNQSPAVQLTAPLSGAEFIAGATVSFAAAAFDQDGSVAKVSLFVNNLKVADDNQPPYAFDYPNMVAGTYTVFATATDNSGATTTSAAVTVFVAPAPAAPPEVAFKPVPLASACTLAEVVSVVDGDTLRVRSGQAVESVRISQIDAPERSQAFGIQATACLSRVVAAGTVNVCRDGVDKYGRTVANIEVNGTDAARSMVAQGCAWAYTKYLEANSTLPALEQAAMQARLGLWAEPALEPWIFRSGGSPVTFNVATGFPAVMVQLSNRGAVYDRVFDWAEHTFTDLLINGTANQVLADGTIYRCYSTNFCIGYLPGRFLTYDGSVIAEVGTEEALLRQAEAQGF